MTEGLNQTIKKFLCYLFNPSPPELRSFGLSPILLMQHRGEGWIVPAHHIKNARPWKKKNLPSSYILKKIGKSTLRIRIHVPLSKGYFKTPPLPCSAALRGSAHKIGAEAKGKYISPSSSVFCAAKYRGGVRRTEGLKNSDSNKIKYQTLPCRA